MIISKNDWFIIMGIGALIIILIVVTNICGMQQVIPAEVHNKHRSHDIQSIVGTIGETKIDIVQDKLHESDQDQNLVSMKKRTLILSHGTVSLITALIMGGVTLVVKYKGCN